jgi:hypothetical protein
VTGAAVALTLSAAILFNHQACSRAVTLRGSNSQPSGPGLRGVAIFVDESAEGGVAADGCDFRVAGSWLGSRRTDLLSAVWPLVVVVIDIFGQGRLRV